MVVFLGVFVGLFGFVTGGAVSGNFGPMFSFTLAVFHGTIGFFLGLVGAPVVEPAGFKFPKLWQMTTALAGCILFAASIGASLAGYALAIAVGCVAGYTANHWVRYASP